MDVGFIGLGAMGRAMAANLVKAGHRVHAWNRSSKAGGMVAGITMVASPAEAFAAEDFAADVVFTMLSDDAAIREVLLSSDVLDRAPSATVHVVTSTISVAFADELRERHEAAGVGYVAAPVFGRPDVAEKGRLAIVAAGKPDDIEKVSPLLDVIGRKTWVLGDDPKRANAAKIAGNMMIAMAIEALAEAAVLIEGAGLGRAAFFDLMLQTQFGGSRAYENYSAKIVNGDFEPGFRMRLGLKDLQLATAAAAACKRPLPMLDAVHARMSEAADAGMADRDWSAVADYTLQR